MTKKLFVSLPMCGKDPEEIRASMNDICEKINQLWKVTGPFELINTVWEEPEPDGDIHHTYYLGKSISALSQADVVIFHPDWYKAKGCLIEYEVCQQYDIPYHFYETIRSYPNYII